MNQIRPLGETAESVTLSRSDFEAMHEELEDATDRIAVLEDCIIDMKPDLNNMYSPWMKRCGSSMVRTPSRFGVRRGA